VRPPGRPRTVLRERALHEVGAGHRPRRALVPGDVHPALAGLVPARAVVAIREEVPAAETGAQGAP
jgi:hypothetical protein